MSHGTQKMGGRKYTAAKAELRSRGDAYCWRGCGTWLLTDAPNGHPQQMTLGHYIAREDGGALYDPDNYGPECRACNYSDGARRTNLKRGVAYHGRHGNTEPPPPQKPHVDDSWWKPYTTGPALAFDPSITKDGCPICGSMVAERRRYCSPECRTEYRLRTSRARTDRRNNRVPRDLSIPSTFRSTKTT